MDEEKIRYLIECVKRHTSAEEIQELYDELKQDIMAEIRYSDLALTKMLITLLDLYQRDPQDFQILLTFLANPLGTFRELADKMQIPLTTVWRRIRRVAQNSTEIRTLLQIRQAGRQGAGKRGRKSARRPAEAPSEGGTPPARGVGGQGGRVLPQGVRHTRWSAQASRPAKFTNEK